MTMFETRQQADSDACVRVEIPVAKAGQTYRLRIQIEEADPNTFCADDWPERYIESTAGAWQGDFSILPEGEFESRVSL